MKKFIIVTTVWLLNFSCQSNVDEVERPGIVPLSIEDVVDIFELKYGETKEWLYNDRPFKFSIVDIDDHLLPCELIDFGGDPEGFNKTILQTILRVETDKEVTKLKVKTKPCFANFYENDGSDIRYLWDVLESWQAESASKVNDLYFRMAFSSLFGEGTLLEKPSLSIYIAKVYSCRFDSEHIYNVENSMYKFIFIVTTCSNNKI